MTKKRFLTKKLIIALLAVLCIFCTCAFFVACGSAEEETETETTYSYTEKDTTSTDFISNAKFAYGTHGKTVSDFPMTSLTGWTRSVDNSAETSNVNSGVISLASTAAWEKLFDTLYADTDFVKFFDYKYKDEATAHYKTESGDDEHVLTETEKKAYYATKFVNPETHDGAADSFVYMLNNYSATYNFGTAQRLRSSTTVSVKKGEIYEISVWVKTNIVSGDGANIRLANAINGNSQAEFRIDGINNADWTEYKIYFVASEDYDCTFTLTLGLGYGTGKNNYAKTVEGTAFFDDISIKKITEDQLDAATVDGSETLVLGSSEEISVSAGSGTAFKYDMNFDASAYFTDSVSVSDIDGELISANGTAAYDKASGVATLENATAKLTLKNGTNNFELTTDDNDNHESYMLISFRLQNKLNYLGSTAITVNVVEEYAPDRNEDKTYSAVATFSDVSNNDEFENCIIVIKNNFKDLTRTFYLEIVIGPADFESATYALSEFATGTVKIKDVKFATGYVSSERYADKADDIDYKTYSFFNSDADATTALYAGYNADYTEHNHTATYSLTPANGTVGQIITSPTAVNGYSGIVSDHVYVNGTSDTYAINDRLNFSGENGYAGLVNTKHLTNYPAELSDILTELKGEDDIQPIVIYNKNADHYGFIGTQQSVSASAYAKVSVKVKVVGDNANAYIYLVDTLNAKKGVMEFAKFKVNTTDGLKNGTINGTEYSAESHKFMLVIDKDTEVGDDGFAEVNFYLATGADAKSFRVEIWNGGRDGAADTASQGYVIVNSITVSTSGAFSEPATWQAAFDSTDSPLSSAKISSFNAADSALIAYTRELTDKEKAFNKEYPDKVVSYSPTYVWANNETLVYGVFNTINPVEVNPYDSIQKDEEGSGCAKSSDPSTFWMSFSSIILAVVLILAIAALFIKRFRLRRKANRSNVKAQYKVKSRTESQKAINKVKERKAKETEDVSDEVIPDKADDNGNLTETDTTLDADDPAADESADNSDETEQSGYVYGEVQDFGDMTLEMPEDGKPEENPAEDKKDE